MDVWSKLQGVRSSWWETVCEDGFLFQSRKWQPFNEREAIPPPLTTQGSGAPVCGASLTWGDRSPWSQTAETLLSWLPWRKPLLRSPLTEQQAAVTPRSKQQEEDKRGKKDRGPCKLSLEMPGAAAQHGIHRREGRTGPR